MNRTADTHALEKLDCAALPVNRPNKETQASAETGKGRAQTKENTVQSQSCFQPSKFSPSMPNTNKTGPALTTF